MAAYRLALALGRIDVDGMLSEISSLQFEEWLLFQKREPWGFEVDNLRAGIIAATVANASPNRRRGSRTHKPQDYMIKTHKKKMTWRDQLTLLKGVFKRNG